MARAPTKKLDNEGDQPAAGPVTESITYMPGNGDPTTVEWGGHTFRANVAKELTGHPEGSSREQLNHEIIERARDNPHFKVGDAKPKRTSHELPTTAEGYRSYIAAWLQEAGPQGRIQTADQLIRRFAKDRELQAACEVGASDWDLIATLFVPKLHDMAKGDELTPEQIAHLWVNAGVNQLPW